jgi:TPP-dependent pyruvate/acetoin dehydrogenase alpha subunit
MRSILPRAAELYGKVDGCARGKAGSMHLVDPSVGMMGTSAVVATGISNAVGAALALKMQRSRAIVVCFFGEGATDEGAWHESMNFASLKKLPILFVCENNFFAIYSHVKDRMAGPGLRVRSKAYGIEAELIEDHEPMKLHERAGVAIAAVRSGSGPRFLECMTYRWRDHVGPGEDRIHKYRPDEELDAKIEGDNLGIVGDLLSSDLRKSIEAAEEKRVADAIAFAEASTFPEDQEIYDHVFSG